MPELPTSVPAPPPGSQPGTLEPDRIAALVLTLRKEAEDGRSGGPSNRDSEWSQAIDLYWNRYDFSGKAKWQSKQVTPEVPVFVDRWAAAMKMSLVRAGEFYTVTVEGDTEKDLSEGITKLMEVALRRVGRNATGQRIKYSAVFEEQMKYGALMMAVGVVTWQPEAKGPGYVAVGAVDPRTTWFDPTGRGLYRFRRLEMDKHSLLALAKSANKGKSKPFKVAEIEKLTATIDEKMRVEREKAGGTGQQTSSGRVPIIVDEFYGDLIDDDGTVIATNSLIMLANDLFVIRGPEDNPFWHGQDWLVATPLVPMGLSPYGRSYAETWIKLAITFNELTNLILDAVRTTAMKAFGIRPDLLQNPSEAAEGLSPNKTFLLAEDADIDKFLKAIDLGRMPAEVVQVWQAVKKELQEGAHLNEIMLGQLAPKGRTSVGEIERATEGGTAFLQSVVETVETRFLAPTLDLVWRTQLQHLSKDDTELRQALGASFFDMLLKRKREFAESRVLFEVRGLSGIIERTERLSRMISFLQLTAQNEQLMGELFKVLPPAALLREMLELYGIQLGDLTGGGRESILQGVAETGVASGESTGGQRGTAARSPAPLQGKQV